ncbi:DNA-binding transcriptional LysR family regulator [Gluconobacter cerinus]|uniref:LysR family transcriptional regulator n=1 Tax=Gluconobacter cerinus TaxID=38307 RepID=UPI002227DECC|nr:LysR family transcriptional regulator [Gluconobacter cerinus]MCW2266914.1 DNA-binding transcriptional LysR family regulator [Gluconobacter cerinus]
MDLRHLRYFIAIADHGSFTRAAEVLHIEQPPLSQQIKSLETELGLKLFERSRRGAVLTDAGEQLVEQARTILTLEHQFRLLATGLARGEQGRLRIGMAGAVSLLPLIPQAIRAFREKWPEIQITLEESNTPALCEALNESRVDIAIVRPPAPDPGISLHPLFDAPTLIAVPKGHPLSQRGTLRLTDVANEPFLIFDRTLGPGFYDAIISACQQAGFTPHFGQSAPQIAATVPMVAAGLGVSIVPAYLSQIHVDGATFHRIEGPSPRASISLASRTPELSGPSANFHKILLKLATSEGK